MRVSYAVAACSIWSAALTADAQSISPNLSECINAPNGVTSSVCITNPGHAGVSRVLFDRPARRRLSKVNLQLSTPYAVATIPSVQLGNIDNFFTIHPQGLWLTETGAPTRSSINIINELGFKDPPDPPEMNSTQVVDRVSLWSGSGDIPSNVRVEILSADLLPEFSGPKQDELLVVVGGGNGRISIVDPNSMPTPFAVTHPVGWDLAAHGVSLADLRDVEVTDINEDDQAEVLLLFPNRVVVLTGGTSPSSTSFQVFSPTITRAPRVIAARKLLGASTRTIFVACDGATSVLLRSYEWTGTTWAFISEAGISAPEALAAAPELMDLADGKDWGLVLTLEGGRDTAPPPLGFMGGHEALVGALITIADAVGNPTVVKDVALFPGGARRIAVRDLGPATPERVLSADGTTFVEASASSTDGFPELLVLGDGARGEEVFRVGEEQFRIPRRLGQIALFQGGASHNAFGQFRPTSLWRLASPLDVDVVKIRTEPNAENLAMLDRVMHGLAFGQLDEGPEPEILTVDTANRELVVLRVQPLPCATVISGFVHGHQGFPSQATPLPPPVPQIGVDESVDVAAAGTTEHIRRANEARRPGRPYDENNADTIEHCAIRNMEIRAHWEKQRV
jgi:hypothetical protein